VRARAHERVTYLAVRDNQISTGLHVVPLTSVYESENRNVKTAEKVCLHWLKANAVEYRGEKFYVYGLSAATSTKNIKHTTHVSDLLIHSVFCLTTGPKPPPKRCLHIVRFRASSFK